MAFGPVQAEDVAELVRRGLLAESTASAGLSEALAAHPLPRLLAAGVRRDRVDLVGRDVELVAPSVLEEQIVPLGAANGALHHPREARHSMDVVHDEAPDGEVVEEALDRAGTRSGESVRPAPPRKVGLGEYCKPRRLENVSLVDLRDHHPQTRSTE